MQKFKTYFMITLKTLGVFIATFGLIFLGIYGFYEFQQKKQLDFALRHIKEKPLNLPLVEPSVTNYLFTAQTWSIPHYSTLLSPMTWLHDNENCILSTRMDSMKFAGLIPQNFTIREFVKNFSSRELYGKYGLNVWNNTLNETILSEINAKLNKNSKYIYKWVSIGSMDELIYLAKRGQHVLVGVTIWMAPNKSYKEARRYRNSPISHAMTITGIKSYDPKEDLIEFAIHDPLPFNWINYMPVYNKFNPKGYNLFKRHAVPYLVKNGRAKSGYVIRVLRPETMQKSSLSLKNSTKNASQNRSF